MKQFEVIDCSQESDEQNEYLGTKKKFWFKNRENGRLWLFKESREGTGEHWSEKVAEQLCILLSIPHARYELARRNQKHGVVTEKLVEPDCELINGNQVLYCSEPYIYPQPPEEENHHARNSKNPTMHTLNRVLRYLDDHHVAPPINQTQVAHLNAGDVFCGYLMLDALISNQDRHHENWALIKKADQQRLYLCASYDHAASLGRELSDEERRRRLESRDQNFRVEAFVKKARSALYKTEQDKKCMLTLEAFQNSVDGRPEAKKFWLGILQGLKNEQIKAILEQMPAGLMSDNAKKFALEMLVINRKRILQT